MLLHRPENETQKGIARWWGQAGKRVAATRLEHTVGLGDGRLGIGKMQDTEVADNTVEAICPKRQVLGVSILNVRFRTSLARDGHNILGKVQGGDDGPPLDSGGSEPPGPTGDDQQ